MGCAGSKERDEPDGYGNAHAHALGAKAERDAGVGGGAALRSFDWVEGDDLLDSRATKPPPLPPRPPPEAAETSHKWEARLAAAASDAAPASVADASEEQNAGADVAGNQLGRPAADPLPPALADWAAEHPDAHSVWAGVTEPESWAAACDGLIRLVEMIDEAGADLAAAHVAKAVLFRACAHCDIFFSGRANPRSYGEVVESRRSQSDWTFGNRLLERRGAEITPAEFVHRLQVAAEMPLARLPAKLHALAVERGLDRPFDRVPMPPAPIVHAKGWSASEYVKTGLTQAHYVPYLQRHFDQIVHKLLSDQEWGARLGSDSPLKVVLAMLLVHSEYIDGLLHQLYPAGIGAANGRPKRAPTKTADRARAKVLGDYHGLAVAPNRPGEDWGESWWGDWGSCDFERGIGEPHYFPTVQATDRTLFARTVTSVGCLLDTVRCSVETADNDAQQDLLLELGSDPARWEVLRVKSTLTDPTASVKQCLVNVLFTPPSETGSDAAVPATYREMTASNEFGAAAERVRRRDGLDSATVSAACELLSAPELANQPIRMVIELQLYITEFLHERRLVHGFYKVVRADDPMGLSADCVKHGAEGSAMRCSAVMLEHRGAVTPSLEGDGAGLADATWNLREMKPGRMHDLAAVLAESTTVARINLSDNEVGSEGVLLLCGELCAHTTLKEVVLARVGVKSEGVYSRDSDEIDAAAVAAVGEVIRADTVLALMDFSGNSIGDGGARLLGNALKVNTTLTELILVGNEIGPVGAQALGKALKVNTALNKIILTGNKLGPAGAQALGEALQVNTVLHEINVSNNKLGPAGAQALGEALEVNTTLIQIDLSNNKVGPVGAQALGKALKVNTALTLINLCGNDLGPVGAQVLGEALKVNTTLTDIDLSCTGWHDGNFIGPAGAKALGDALKVNTTLTRINLSGSGLEASCGVISSNNLGPEGAQVLGGALKVNTTLSEIDLSRNLIGDKGAEALGEALRVNTGLTTIVLEQNAIRDAGAVALAEALCVNTALKFIDLSSDHYTYGDNGPNSPDSQNRIKDEGAVALAGALRVNTTLTKVNLRLNPLGQYGKPALDDAIRANAVLSQIPGFFKWE